MIIRKLLIVICMYLMALLGAVNAGDLENLLGGEVFKNFNRGEKLMGVYEIHGIGQGDSLHQFQREIYQGLNLNFEEQYKIELFPGDPTIQDTNCRVVCVTDSETGKMVCVTLC